MIEITADDELRRVGKTVAACVFLPVIDDTGLTIDVPEPRPQRLRFSFREQREFETIDGDIAALEAELARCEGDIAANASDYVRLQALSEEKQRLEAELEARTERWVYLNDLAERIAAQEASRR